MECLAQILGNCGGGGSREHYISDGIFEGEQITASGLHWCSDGPVSISLASATSKILCKRHNEALSDFDSEASKLSKFVTSNIFDQPLTGAEITLDGGLLEKWSWKTLLNLGYLGALDRPSFTRLTPPLGIVECLFTSTLVPEGADLYLISGSLTNEGYKIGLSWKAIRNHGTGKVLGMAFTFNGLRFVVHLLPTRAEHEINSMGLATDFDYAAANVTYRPNNVIFGSKSAGKKIINLKW